MAAIVLRVMNHTGHTELRERVDDMTREQIRAEFDKMTRPRSKGGAGMLAVAGTTLDDLEVIKSWGDLEKLEGDQEELVVTLRGQTVGG